MKKLLTIGALLASVPALSARADLDSVVLDNGWTFAREPDETRTVEVTCEARDAGSGKPRLEIRGINVPKSLPPFPGLALASGAASGVCAAERCRE